MIDASSGLPLPAALVAAAEQESRTAWLATLSATVARLARQWQLQVAAPFQPGGRPRGWPRSGTAPEPTWS